MIHYTSACLKCVGPKDIQGGETSCVSPEPSANSVPLKEVFISQTFKTYPQDILFTSMLKKKQKKLLNSPLLQRWSSSTVQCSCTTARALAVILTCMTSDCWSQWLAAAVTWIYNASSLIIKSLTAPVTGADWVIKASEGYLVTLSVRAYLGIA